MADGATMNTMLIKGEARRKKHLSRPLQTPGDVLDFWFDDCSTSMAGLDDRHKLWFAKSDDTCLLYTSDAADES